MGLEKHVNQVLKDAGVARPLWKWENGLVVRDDVDAKFIMEILDEDGGFGPSSYNKKTCKITFGEYHEERPEKPTVELVGKDGNVFSIIGTVQKELKKAGLADQAKEFIARAFKEHDYDAVLRLVMEYVEVE